MPVGKPGKIRRGHRHKLTVVVVVDVETPSKEAAIAIFPLRRQHIVPHLSVEPAMLGDNKLFSRFPGKRRNYFFLIIPVIDRTDTKPPGTVPKGFANRFQLFEILPIDLHKAPAAVRRTAYR